MNDKIILGFPGPWETREKVVEEIFNQYGSEVVFANNILKVQEKNIAAEMFIYDYDPNVRSTFEFAGKGRISDYDLVKLAAHKHTIYLKLDRGGEDLRERLTLFSDIMTSIGAFAVKVETSGIAWGIVEWMNNLNSGETLKLYNSLVTLIKSSHYFYSCGMHSFGQPDSCVSKLTGLKDAAHLLNSFNMYQLKENPEFETGQIFTVSEGGDRYRMKLQDDFLLGEEPFFVNSFGRWVLEHIKD